MPLSDEEARLLQQLEQSLAAEDPEFASTLRGSKQAARNRKVAAVSGLGLLAGLAVLFAGAVTATTWVGVIGFLVMLAGGYFFVTAWRHGLHASPDAAPSRSPRSSTQKQGGSFVNRMEERWQRRQDGDDR